jgi:septal ring factor EnvC (AmiA/AmiB activator)
MRATWRLAAAGASVLLLVIATHPATVAFAQGPIPPANARQIDDRLAALQREAADLARQSRTLLGELRRLEIERDLKTVQARRADREVAEASLALVRSSARLQALEATRVEQEPELARRLVDLYKHGRRGYALRLVAAGNSRDFTRALRAVSSLASTTQRRIVERQQTMAALKMERAERATQLQRLETARAQAEEARLAADRAVSSRLTLLSTIDQRRDLAAQLTGELQAAADRLRAQVSALENRETSAPAAGGAVLPRGTLNWPVAGRVTTLFGEGADRPGQFAVRNGIEIQTTEEAPVLAIADGTVAFADPFVGFGTLVIVDHGDGSYSLYGYLRSAGVKKGDRITGGAELGRAGLDPAGTPALYLEVRVDGRAVDPVQWLKPKS